MLLVVSSKRNILTLKFNVLFKMLTETSFNPYQIPKVSVLFIGSGRGHAAAHTGHAYNPGATLRHGREDVARYEGHRDAMKARHTVSLTEGVMVKISECSPSGGQTNEATNQLTN
jgi:hypothetical protein